MVLPYMEGPYEYGCEEERLRRFHQTSIKLIELEKEHLSSVVVVNPARGVNILPTTEEEIKEEHVENIKIKYISKEEFIELQHLEIMKEWAKIQNINLVTLEVQDQEDSIKTKLNLA